jgi:hypothetical protein
MRVRLVHPSGHFIPAMILGNSPLSPRQYLSEKPSHSPYLHENNHQTPKALFSFLYNGFRGSRFTRLCRLRRHSHSAAIYSCADYLRPRLVSTLPLAAPRIFDNCINRHQPAGRRSHAGEAAHGQPPPASLAAARAIRQALVYGP